MHIPSASREPIFQRMPKHTRTSGHFLLNQVLTELEAADKSFMTRAIGSLRGLYEGLR